MFNSIIASPITLTQFLVCMVTALVLGVLASCVFTFRNTHTGSRRGAGAAAVRCGDGDNDGQRQCRRGARRSGDVRAGALSLRARNGAGDNRAVFSVALGLACGMGYVGLAAVFFVLFSAALLALGALHFGERGGARVLKITIPKTSTMRSFLTTSLKNTRAVMSLCACARRIWARSLS